MIEINNLIKNFGEKTAVSIEHFQIQSGQMLGLVGNNGAGKTTLFRLALDLLEADQGNVTIEGVDVSKSEEWKKTTGAFIDDGFLIDYLSPEEFFYFSGRLYGLSKEEIDERLKEFEHFMSICFVVYCHLFLRHWYHKILVLSYRQLELHLLFTTAYQIGFEALPDFI